MNTLTTAHTQQHAHLHTHTPIHLIKHTIKLKNTHTIEKEKERGVLPVEELTQHRGTSWARWMRADKVGGSTEAVEEGVVSEGVRARWRDNLRHGGLGQDASEEGGARHWWTSGGSWRGLTLGGRSWVLRGSPAELVTMDGEGEATTYVWGCWPWLRGARL